MTTTHTQLVLELLDSDPSGARAAELREKIGRMESRDPSLFGARIELFASHELCKVGEQPPAECEPSGEMLT